MKVAFTGLGIVLLLIGLASLLLGSVSHNHVPAVSGATGAGAAAHPSNGSDPSEPLAELGVTPSTQSNASQPEAAIP